MIEDDILAELGIDEDPVDPVVEAFQAFLDEASALSLSAFRAQYKDDFFGFCLILEIKPKDASDSGRIPFVPTHIQRAYSEARTPRDVILKPRQVKITTIELARDVWYFLTKPGVAVRVFCQSSTDGSMLNELSERVGVYFEALKKNAGLVLDFVSESRTAWTLPNGSSLKIIQAGASAAAAQKKGRGETVHRLHATEIAFWEFAGKTLNAALEAIAGPHAGTEVVFESTANGAAGDDQPSMSEATGAEYFFWLCQAARRNANGYKLHFFPWFLEPEYALPLNPGETIDPEQQPDQERRERERRLVAMGISPEQLKWYRQKVDAKGSLAETDQEYPSDPDTCFLVSGRQYFDKQRTEALLDQCSEPIETREIKRSGAIGTVRIWRRPEPKAVYILACDTSEGTGGDCGAAQVWERGTGRHMATLWGQFRPSELAKEAAALGYEFNTAQIGVERNNHGHAVLQELEREDPTAFGDQRKRRYPKILVDRDGKPGWLSSSVSRTEALSELERAHREGEWSTPDREVVREMRTFLVSKKGRAEAKQGARDDLVLTAAIARDMLSRILPQAPAPPPLLVRDQDSTPMWG